MAVTHATRFTAKEYLALEGVAETRHEFAGGQIVAMAGAELEHNQIAQNVRTELAGALADRPCRILSSDQRVFVEAVDEYFYPDVLVTRLEPRLVEPKPRSLVNPQVIIEVLSETTERYDRVDKWSAYRTIPSLTDYVMVSSTKRGLELSASARWIVDASPDRTIRNVRSRQRCHPRSRQALSTCSRTRVGSAARR